MSSPIVQDFAFDLKIDNGLLAQSALTGEAPDNAEIMSLAAAAQALYISATLESRALGRIDACHRLWRETAALFAELCDSWTGVQSTDPAVRWLRSQLEHYRSLCEDRCDLYRVSESERRVYAKRKAFDSDSEYSFGTRGEIAAHCEKGVGF
jgi:hypothetical protein